MGTCLCKELQRSMAVLQGEVEEGQPPPGQNDLNPPDGSTTDKISRYDIGELATSSLLGLVATIKDHITKPTAMAQGRVAHLIEWKGWGGGGGEAGATGGGGAGEVWKGLGAELQDDELLYAQMTDEIKEARFAAGVAAQFALAEAAMDVCFTDEIDRPSVSWEATQSHYMAYYLRNGGVVGVPQCLHDNHPGGSASPLSYPTEPPPPAVLHPTPPPPSSVPALATTAQTHGAVSGTLESGRRLQQFESISLSEDEVFYN
ncbi:protein FAM131C [Gadus chalcogrammus]|uniref:protein FAM131C n=1 Tax=Gadus chalcogrammus TaxID=1042646 RepID=UPI0024C46E08|nr:protein FAM131C [Gadus chalcogrammus]